MNLTRNTHSVRRPHPHRYLKQYKEILVNAGEVPLIVLDNLEVPSKGEENSEQREEELRHL